MGQIANFVTHLLFPECSASLYFKILTSFTIFLLLCRRFASSPNNCISQQQMYVKENSQSYYTHTHTHTQKKSFAESLFDKAVKSVAFSHPHCAVNKETDSHLTRRCYLPLALPNHLLHDLHTFTKTLSVSVVIKLSSTKVDKHTCCLSM